MNQETEQQIQQRYTSVMTSKTFGRIVDAYKLKDKRVLDMGCGYGEFMQRFGSDSVGITTTRAEVAYGQSHNIDIREGNAELLDKTISPTENFDTFWANNLFEHLLSPHAFLVNLKQYAKNDALLILGVPVVPKIESLMMTRKFRGALATPHINFFTKKTLELTVTCTGWDVLESRPFFRSSSLIDNAISPMMPHIYIVAKNSPTYQYPPKKVHEWEDNEHYQNLLSIMDGRGKQSNL